MVHLFAREQMSAPCEKEERRKEKNIHTRRKSNPYFIEKLNRVEHKKGEDGKRRERKTDDVKKGVAELN